LRESFSWLDEAAQAHGRKHALSEPPR
jgi:hypothetical protein